MLMFQVLAFCRTKVKKLRFELELLKRRTIALIAVNTYLGAPVGISGGEGGGEGREGTRAECTWTTKNIKYENSLDPPRNEECSQQNIRFPGITTKH